MSANSSLSNDSLLDEENSFFCFHTSPAVIVFSLHNIAYFILLLPLCTIIVHFGIQQLKETKPASTMSHCDSFTYHMVSMEMISILGCVICFCGNCLGNKNIFISGLQIFSFTWYGQVFFHILTCVERYLAVVHPITYLSLRKERGVRMRNITIGCVWFLSVVGITFETVVKSIFLNLFLLTFSTVVISFCSLTVLWVLIHPGPGGRGEGRERVDKSKQKAFYTIMIILGILMLRLFFGLIWAGVELSDNKNRCVMMACGVWINLPSSLVLPLLFLQRAGK